MCIMNYCLFEGTGKTVTGIHTAYWFVKRNMKLQPQENFLDTEDSDIDDPDCAHQTKSPRQVIYCGPSNKSVDVVAST